MYDIIIIGAGPAGLTAALYARRADKQVLILEKENFGGQITYSPKVENYPSFKQISGNELAQLLLEQVMEHGAEIELAEVTEIRNCDDKKTVITDSGTFEARTVILAVGSKHRHLNLPKEDFLIGKGISYCAVCDGAFFAGLPVAVVGGGNTALQEAMLLSEYCSHVTIIQNLPEMTGETRLLRLLKQKKNVSMILNTVVTKLNGTEQLNGITLQNTQTDITTDLAVDGLFIAIGQEPSNERFGNIAKLSPSGYIESDETCLTDTTGIFVAGDCRTKAIRQITTATADGTVAALAAIHYLENH